MSDKKNTPRGPSSQPPGWIKGLQPGDVVLPNDATRQEKIIKYGEGVGAKEFMRGPNQWEYLQGREDDPTGVDTYSKGGRVKHGSSTVIKCKNK